MDLNHRPSGYEPDELPSCSTPSKNINLIIILFVKKIKENLKKKKEERKVYLKRNYKKVFFEVFLK